MCYRSSRNRRKERAESIFKEIMPKNFPNVGKERDIQIKEAQHSPKKINPKRSTSRHTIMKLSEIKDRIVKGRIATCLYTGIPIRLTDFSAKLLQPIKDSNDIFKVCKEKKMPRMLYPANMSFRIGVTEFS